MNRDDLTRAGVKTCGTYRGPLDLVFAVRLLFDLYNTTMDPDGNRTGTTDNLLFGPIVIVQQDNGYNLVEIVEKPQREKCNEKPQN